MWHVDLLHVGLDVLVVEQELVQELLRHVAHLAAAVQARLVVVIIHVGVGVAVAVAGVVVHKRVEYVVEFLLLSGHRRSALHLHVWRRMMTIRVVWMMMMMIVVGVGLVVEQRRVLAHLLLLLLHHHDVRVAAVGIYGTRAVLARTVQNDRSFCTTSSACWWLATALIEKELAEDGILLELGEYRVPQR